jgi:methylenetetrahydrofolate dehydrogenase (NADP+)/methenyltetrahydrofolate cyclohydrolase
MFMPIACRKWRLPGGGGTKGLGRTGRINFAGIGKTEFSIFRRNTIVQEDKKMAKQLLGKEVTAALNEKIMGQAAELKEKGIIPKLGIIRVGENSSDISYEKGATKRCETLGVEVEKILLPEDISKEELLKVIDKVNKDDSIHGVLMFRPLPKHLKADQSEIENALDPAKDVDCMTDGSMAGVFTGKPLGFPPCTPQACMEILDYYGIDCKGKNAVVIGRSLVVGKPAAMMLMAKNATVTVCHTRTVNTAEIAKGADILISAAGVLNSLTKDYVSPGQVVIDVSINWDAEKPNSKGGKGAIAGDAVYSEVEPIVEAITPVPGGVGAVTTSVLVGHVVEAAMRTVK